MKWIILALLAAGCAHGIRNLSDCGQVQAADRKLQAEREITDRFSEFSPIELWKILDSLA